MSDYQKLYAEIATQILVARLTNGDGLPKDTYLAYRAAAHAKVIITEALKYKNPTHPANQDSHGTDQQ